MFRRLSLEISDDVDFSAYSNPKQAALKACGENVVIPSSPDSLRKVFAAIITQALIAIDEPLSVRILYMLSKVSSEQRSAAASALNPIIRRCNGPASIEVDLTAWKAKFLPLDLSEFDSEMRNFWAQHDKVVKQVPFAQLVKAQDVRESQFLFTVCFAGLMFYKPSVDTRIEELFPPFFKQFFGAYVGSVESAPFNANTIPKDAEGVSRRAAFFVNAPTAKVVGFLQSEPVQTALQTMGKAGHDKRAQLALKAQWESTGWELREHVLVSIDDMSKLDVTTFEQVRLHVAKLFVESWETATPGQRESLFQHTNGEGPPGKPGLPFELAYVKHRSKVVLVFPKDRDGIVHADVGAIRNGTGMVNGHFTKFSASGFHIGDQSLNAMLGLLSNTLSGGDSSRNVLVAYQTTHPSIADTVCRSVAKPFIERWPAGTALKGHEIAPNGIETRTSHPFQDQMRAFHELSFIKLNEIKAEDSEESRTFLTTMRECGYLGPDPVVWEIVTCSDSEFDSKFATQISSASRNRGLREKVRVAFKQAKGTDFDRENKGHLDALRYDLLPEYIIPNKLFLSRLYKWNQYVDMKEAEERGGLVDSERHFFAWSPLSAYQSATLVSTEVSSRAASGLAPLHAYQQNISNLGIVIGQLFSMTPAPSTFAEMRQKLCAFVRSSGFFPDENISATLEFLETFFLDFQSTDSALLRGQFDFDAVRNALRKKHLGYSQQCSSQLKQLTTHINVLNTSVGEMLKMEQIGTHSSYWNKQLSEFAELFRECTRLTDKTRRERIQFFMGKQHIRRELESEAPYKAAELLGATPVIDPETEVVTAVCFPEGADKSMFAAQKSRLNKAGVIGFENPEEVSLDQVWEQLKQEHLFRFLYDAVSELGLPVSVVGEGGVLNGFEPTAQLMGLQSEYRARFPEYHWDDLNEVVYRLAWEKQTDWFIEEKREVLLRQFQPDTGIVRGAWRIVETQVPLFNSKMTPFGVDSVGSIAYNLERKAGSMVVNTTRVSPEQAAKTEAFLLKAVPAFKAIQNSLALT